MNDTITFYANATSDIGSGNLTFTIFYDTYDFPLFTPNLESPVSVNVTGNPGAVVTTFKYDHPGNLTLSGKPFFWVTLWVDDGTGSNETTYVQVFVSVYTPPVNQPPRLIFGPDPNLNPTARVAKWVVIDVADKEGDTVTVNWDFGDGTTATNITAAPDAGIYLYQSHTWYPRVPGKGDYFENFTINITFSDGINPAIVNSTNISVTVPQNYAPDPLLTTPRSQVNLLDPVVFVGRASDPEGDPITWTFNYSDGSMDVRHTLPTAPGVVVWQNTTHAFSAVGNYTVYLSVSDALVPFQTGSHNITVQSTTIEVTLNKPPQAPTFDVQPTAPMINATLGYVNVTMSVYALDPDGDMFNVTWDMGVFGTRVNASDSNLTVRKSYTQFIQVLSFNETGSYNISVTVSDGRPGHDVHLFRVINITSNNLPPSVLAFSHDKYSLGDFAASNETIKFVLIVTDREHDRLEISFDFGDGSPKLIVNRSDYDASGNVTVRVNHTYVSMGTYKVIIVVTDNKVGLFNHTITGSLTIVVSKSRVIVSTSWDWWDYTSLGLFMMIPIGLVGWVIMNRRQRQLIEDQGMTYDEWKLMKEIDAEELNK